MIEFLCVFITISPLRPPLTVWKSCSRNMKSLRVPLLLMTKESECLVNRPTSSSSRDTTMPQGEWFDTVNVVHCLDGTPTVQYPSQVAILMWIMLYHFGHVPKLSCFIWLAPIVSKINTNVIVCTYLIFAYCPRSVCVCTSLLHMHEMSFLLLLAWNSWK